MDGDALLQHQRFLGRIVGALARDREEREELLQATWLRALEHPPRSSQAPRAWLARIARNLALNRRRGERNEEAKRVRAAEERSWPPPEEVAARLELAERVLAAVRELPESLRAVVLARYYEELPLDEIARRSGAPLDTVKERLKRAKELLRRRLERELGEEGGFTGLVALCVRWTERIGGGVVVKKVVALVGVVLVGLLVWLRWREPHVSESALQAVVEAPVEVQAPSEARVMPAERVAVPAPAVLAAKICGSLLVSVTWPDGLPAERVTVCAWADEERALSRFFRVATTGPDGLAGIDGLAAGTYRVQLEREEEFVRTEVRAGEETRVGLAVSAGPRIEGLVVDAHGQSVAGAGVWVRGRKYRPGAPLEEGFAAVSAADGRFTILSMGSALLIGARAEGYAPSNEKAIRPSGKPFEEVRLVLPGLGGVLAGRVLDADGAPIANAIVLADVGFRFEPYPSGGMRILNSSRLAVLSGTEGSFRFEGVQPGELELVVLAPDRLRWNEEVRVTPGSTTWVDVALEPGQSVSGRILTPEGGAFAGVIVCASSKGRGEPVKEDAGWLSQDWQSVLFENEDHVLTRSASDGSYRLGGLRPGWTYVAADARERGRELESVRLEPGVEAHMDLVLSRGLELRCRLVDQAGAPLADLPVFVARMGDNGGTMGSRGLYRTDAEGRIAVPNCADALYCLDVRHHRYGRRMACKEASAGLRPGPDEHGLVLDYTDSAPAFVRGVVMDDREAPLAGAAVVCGNEREGFGGCSTRSDANGVFLTGELEPGRYRVVVSADGFPRLKLASIELSEGQTIDLGAIRMKTPGFLSVKLRREDGGRVDDLFDLSLDTATERRVYVSLDVELGQAPFSPIEPGDYVLHVEGQSCFDPRLPVHIDAGRTTELDLLLRIGGYRELRFPGHENAAEISHLHVVVRDAGGQIAFEENVEEAGDGFTTGHAFERGSYVLEATCDDGRHASGAFQVLDREPAGGPLDFDLR